MQEVLFRERNLRFVETSLQVAMLERIGHIMLDGLFGPAENEAAAKARHAPLSKSVSEMLGHYEAELYGDRYQPAYQRAQAVEERRKKFEAIQRAEREAKALQRVQGFSEDEPKPK